VDLVMGLSGSALVDTATTCTPPTLPLSLCVVFFTSGGQKGSRLLRYQSWPIGVCKYVNLVSESWSILVVSRNLNATHHALR
jgi:hypothetical protein